MYALRAQDKTLSTIGTKWPRANPFLGLIPKQFPALGRGRWRAFIKANDQANESDEQNGSDPDNGRRVRTGG